MKTAVQTNLSLLDRLEKVLPHDLAHFFKNWVPCPMAPFGSRLSKSFPWGKSWWSSTPIRACHLPMNRLS